MPCTPKKTIETIVEGGNHYVVQVKGNQPTLFGELQRTITGKPLSYFEEHEKGHGRRSSWHVRVFDASRGRKAGEWKNLRRVIHVHKRTLKNGSESHSDRLYISDLSETGAEFFHRGIRGHWKIENSLHWVKDVVHGEDSNQWKHRNAPVNVAVFSSIAINIHRKNGNHSITESQIKFGANVKELFHLLRT